MNFSKVNVNGNDDDDGNEVAVGDVVEDVKRLVLRSARC